MNASTPKTDFDTLGQLMARFVKHGINFRWLPEDEKGKGNCLVIEDDLDLDIQIKEPMHLTVKGLISSNIDINGNLFVEEHDDSIVTGLKLKGHTIKANSLFMSGHHHVKSSSEWYAISGRGNIIVKDRIYLDDVSINGHELAIKCASLRAVNVVGDVFINADDKVIIEQAENNDDFVPVILADSIDFTRDGPIGSYRFIATCDILSRYGFYDGVKCFSLGEIDGKNGGHDNLNCLDSLFVASFIIGLGDDNKADIVRIISESMPEQYASLSPEIREFVRSSVELIRQYKGAEALEGDQDLLDEINADVARQNGLEKLLKQRPA